MQGKTSAGNPLCKKLPAMAGALLLAANAAAGVSANPVWPENFPDPTIWQSSDGTWLATASSQAKKEPQKILKSRDFFHWEDSGKRVFADKEFADIRKQWKEVWAPDAFRHGDEWLLYVTLYNSAADSAIAVFSSTNACGPFTDGRIVTRSRDTGIKDTIDPEAVRDDRDGTLWLFFGSIGKMHRVKLSDDGKSVAPGAVYEHVAGLDSSTVRGRLQVFEGAYLKRRGGWWYLFASRGWYKDHTYGVVVGRARTLDGPFLDREGRRMIDGFGTTVIESQKGDRFFGPGHNGDIVTIDGKDYIPYHCHIAGKNPSARPLFVSELVWDEGGWPHATLPVPASSARMAAPAMERLPPGSVRPQGWLLKQMELQLGGLTGHAEELYEDIGKSDWLTGEKRGGQFAWERGPYYAKGLVALAFALDDETLKARAKRWVDAYLASQRENGDFGPKDRNWWANMIALWTLRDWCEATGDARVVPFMERYFAFQRKAFAGGDSFAKDSPWAVARVGDELDVLLWLWRKTLKTEWLDYARTVAAMSADWTDYYHNGGTGGWGNEGYRAHIVNFMQGLKTPPLKWLLGGGDADRTAFRAALAEDGWAMRKHGRPDRAVNGTEPLSGFSASQGTELCATAEHILSAQVALETLGDADIADDMEVAAYNTLPATLAPDGRGMRYYCLLNQACCIDGKLLYNNGQGKVPNVPGPYSGFGCCRSNFHFAWPKFLESMWMKRDGGLAATAYGDCTVKTPIATIAETGGYPFSDNVRLEIVEAAGGEWPLFVRIPGWCKDAKVKVNGADGGCARAGSFMRLARKWKKGDVVELSFPSKPAVTHWKDDSIAVMRGPLLYALKIDEDEKARNAADWPAVKKDASGVLRDVELGFPMKELRAKSPWNYALVADGANGEPQFHVKGEGLGLRLAVKAVRTGYAGWGTMMADASARAEDPPPSPIPADKVNGTVEMIELVPIALTQLRITLFPWIKMNISRREFLLGAAALVATSSFGNPIFDGWYADPQIRRYGDTYWVFPTRSDRFAAQTAFDAFSSRDMKTWKKHPRILTTNEVSWAKGALWAPDAHEIGGKYYLFFSANDAYPVSGKRDDGEPQAEAKVHGYGGIGVAVADRPEGPYRDLIGKPLIDRFWNRAQPIDQYVFEYKGEWYMIYGGWRRCNLVKLARDFKSLVPFEDGAMWRDMTPKDYVEGSVMFERKGRWYFMYSGGSWTRDNYCVNYSVGDSPFGPFEFKGKVLGVQRPVATGTGYWIFPTGFSHPNEQLHRYAIGSPWQSERQNA